MSNTSDPLVSIVIPTFNHARYLTQAIQSVLDQSYKNWEAIVIDNYSTDHTDAVIASFSDPRIIYKKIHNQGVIAVSRNIGIALAKGEWIAFLDSDDFWKSDKLQVCLRYADNEVDLIYHDMEIVDNEFRIIKKRKVKSWQVNSPVLIDLMVRGNALIASSVMVRTELLKQINGMDESYDMIAAEDYNTWLRISELTNRFKYLPRKIGFYRVHPQSISMCKDMSLPTSHAVSQFIGCLNPHQRKVFDAELGYIKGRFNYLAGNYTEADKLLSFNFKNAKLLIKFKILLMCIAIKFYRKYQ